MEEGGSGEDVFIPFPEATKTWQNLGMEKNNSILDGSASGDGGISVPDARRLRGGEPRMTEELSIPLPNHPNPIRPQVVRAVSSGQEAHCKSVVKCIVDSK